MSDNQDPVAQSAGRAQFIVGESRTVLATLADRSADCVITSPPYFRLRSYLPDADPDKAREIGQETTPGEYLETLLSVMDDLWRVMTDDATFWINLGDKHAGSGGAGGDYGEGLRAGQPKYGRVPSGSGYPAGRSDNRRRATLQDRSTGVLQGDAGAHWRSRGDDWPSAQSVCWLPDLFGSSLAYGRNPLTGAEHRRWVTRPPVVWCKPNPAVGQLTRRFRTATELIVYGGKHEGPYFNLDAVRTPSDYRRPNQLGKGSRPGGTPPGQRPNRSDQTVNEHGAPPLNWWPVPTVPYPQAHYAVFPPELVHRPVLCGCPPGGTILDPFAGSGTTGEVATGNGRNAILVDLDPRNAELARRRVGMFLSVEDRIGTKPRDDGRDQ